MENAERVFTLKLRHDSGGQEALGLSLRPTVGELWQGEGRVPVSGVLTYRGRVDAVITFFVDQFLNDEIFQDGDSLALASEKGERFVLVTRRGDVREEQTRM